MSGLERRSPLGRRSAARPVGGRSPALQRLTVRLPSTPRRRRKRHVARSIETRRGTSLSRRRATARDVFAQASGVLLSPGGRAAHRLGSPSRRWESWCSSGTLNAPARGPSASCWTPRRLRRTEQPAEWRIVAHVQSEFLGGCPKRPPATRRAEARRGRNDHREITRHPSAKRTDPPQPRPCTSNTLTTWLSATVRLMGDWPALPAPGEFVRLALPCPPQLVELTGYDGPGRLVALWWSPVRR